MLVYLLSATLLWAISLLLYELVFRKLPMHRENRAYLLLSLATGLFLPLFSFSLKTSDTSPLLREPVFQTAKIRRQLILKAVPATDIANPAGRVLMLYATGTAIAVCLLAYQVVALLLIYKRGRGETRSGYILVHTQYEHAPFSFFRYVFIPASAAYEEWELAIIIRHELQHVRRKHSIDVIVLLLLRILFWFHPLVYLYWRRIRLVHEYQADAVEMPNASAYGHFLLEQNMLTGTPSFAHFIFQSPLKNRIAMLLKTSAATRLRYLSVLILLPALFLCCAYAAPGRSRSKKGNKIYYNGNVIEMGGGWTDTVRVLLDSAGGKWEDMISHRDSVPTSLNGQKIYQDEELLSIPRFAGEENDAATMLFNKLRPLLDKLDDDTYQLMIVDVIVDANGRVAYHTPPLIMPSFTKLFTGEGMETEKAIVPGKDDKNDARPPQSSSAKSQLALKQSPLTKMVTAKAEELLSGSVLYKPAIAADGTAVPAIVTDDVDLALRRQIIVKDHKATLTKVVLVGASR